ncbi:MAG TPA: hypothetical protein VNA22_05465 [Pyrinomonadaceae bacterium]|nr:hypothetical protein [Pyrinomonadaceae bacterium]
MNYTVLNIALAILLFVVAYLTFDLYNWTHLLISVVLFLSGIHSLFRDAESPARRPLGRSCLRFAAILSVFLIIKLLIWG